MMTQDKVTEDQVEALLGSFKKYKHLEQYQDIIVNDTVISRGVRECEKRWDFVSLIASAWDRPFTVLDIGANLGYFSLKLARDFDCTVVSCEGIYGDWLQQVFEANDLDNLLLLKKTFTLDDLKTLADVEHFDLVLAMSVVHHIDGEYSEIIETIRSLGDVVLIEVANEANACGQRIVRNTSIPDDAKMIGYGDSHLDTGQRPIFMMEQKRNHLKKAYIGTPLDDINILIDSTFSHKYAYKNGNRYQWNRGINLKTWLEMGGSYPSKEKIKDMILASRPTENHGDLYTHNIILQGDSVKFIDKNDARRDTYNDNITIIKVLEDLQS